MLALIVAMFALLLLTCCRPSEPTESDMAGCAVRGGGPPLSSREPTALSIARRSGSGGSVESSQ